MKTKLSLTIFGIVLIAFLSCNSNENNKEEVLSSPTNTSLAESTVPTIQPSVDLTPYEKKFEADTMNYELRSMLAANYYNAGILDKAAYHFLKIYEHDNKNLMALSNLGNIYYDSQQDDKAIQFYEKALELDNKNINLRCDLATCYGNINKLKKAIQILRENIEMDKNHIQSHHNLSIILKKKGDNTEAAEEMKIYQSLIAAQK